MIHSKSAVNRAGRTLRPWWADPEAEATGEIFAAFLVMSEFRAAFQKPMAKVNMGLRSFARTTAGVHSGADVIVGQRLKRAATILSKLQRHPKMELSRMEDIGGCRVVLPGGLDHVGRMAAHIKRRWDVRREHDYINDELKASGYRAHHIVVCRDERWIEIQLRTQAQHAWGEAIEATGAKLGFALKDGEGPADLLQYFTLLGDALAAFDRGEDVGPISRDLTFMRGNVAHYLA